MRKNTLFLLFVVLSVLSVSCQKINEAEKELHSFNNAQELLSQELDNRSQIIGAFTDNDYYYVFFSDGVHVSFSRKIFPILNEGDNNCWSISGKQTKIPIRYNESGLIETPMLSIGESGFWTIDNAATGISASPYLTCIKETGLKARFVEGIWACQNKSVFLLSDKSSYSLSIIQEASHIVPSYYMGHLKEKEIKAEKAISNSYDNYTAFIFFSDSHWDNNFKHSPALIRHICDYSGISKVFFGGDVIYKHASTPQDAVKEGLDFLNCFRFLGSNFYCVYGNHDNNSEGQVNKTEAHLNDEQISSFLQSQMNVIDKKEGFNFYFDEPQTRTRYVGLDTGRYYRPQFRTTIPNTASFLIEALSDVPEDWHIIVVSHIFMETKKVDGFYECTLANYCDFILDIMDHYNQREAGQFSYNKQTISYDFSDSKGRVEICIGGHVHISGLLHTETGIPIIAVPTDSRNVVNGETAKKGSITEQSVSIVVVDYTSHKTSLISIGRGLDREIDLL